MQNSANAVGALIDIDLDYLEHLISLLKQEREALEQRNAARLMEIVQDKKALLSAMESNGRQRDR